MKKHSNIAGRLIGRDITNAFTKAASEGQSEISLTIPIPKYWHKKTVLDKLRTRGTPLELIGSYLLAAQQSSADAAFRTCVLETLYEQLEQEFKPAIVTFKNSNDLHTDLHTTGAWIESGGNLIVAITAPEHTKPVKAGDIDSGMSHKQEPRVFVPHMKSATSQREAITDSVNASIYKSIHNTVEWYCTEIKQILADRYSPYLTYFQIITDKSSANIFFKDDQSALMTKTEIMLIGYLVLTSA